MATGYTPDIGIMSPAAAQYLSQKKVIVGEAGSWSFGTEFNPAKQRTFSLTRGLPTIRVGIYQYPEYDRGDFTFPARNYLQWRVVGCIPSATITNMANSIFDMVPLTTPQLMPVNQPISITIDAGGLYAVAVEVDTTSGTTPFSPGNRDMVLISISASP